MARVWSWAKSEFSAFTASNKYIETLIGFIFLLIYPGWGEFAIWFLPFLGRLLAYFHEEEKAHWIESNTASLSFCSRRWCVEDTPGQAKITALSESWHLLPECSWHISDVAWLSFNPLCRKVGISKTCFEDLMGWWANCSIWDFENFRVFLSSPILHSSSS